MIPLKAAETDAIILGLVSDSSQMLVSTVDFVIDALKQLEVIMS